MKTFLGLALLISVLLLGCATPNSQTTPTPASTSTPLASPSTEIPTMAPTITPAKDSVSPTPAPTEKTGYSLGLKFDLSFGQTVQVDALTVTFSNVTEDSRCPSDVRCVWAGRVVAEFTAKKGDAGGTIEMTPNSRYPPKAGFGGYRIVLYAVNPYPSTKDPIEKQEYVATISVEKTN